MLELQCTPPRPDGSVGRGVFLGLVLDLFQIVLFPSIAILCEIVFRPSEKPLLIAIMLYFYAWSLTRFVYLAPAALVAYRRRQRKTAMGFLMLGGLGVVINVIWLAPVLSSSRFVSPLR
jgi:hypothetical protein